MVFQAWRKSLSVVIDCWSCSRPDDMHSPLVRSTLRHLSLSIARQVLC